MLKNSAALPVAGEIAGRVVGEGGRVDGRVAVGQGIEIQTTIFDAINRIYRIGSHIKN
jgi:hypothetical protein